MNTWKTIRQILGIFVITFSYIAFAYYWIFKDNVLESLPFLGIVILFEILNVKEKLDEMEENQHPFKKAI